MAEKFQATTDTDIFPDWEELSGILESIASGIFIINRDGIIIYWNRAAEKISGYHRNEMLGMPCGQLPGETCDDGDCCHGLTNCRLFRETGSIERECRITGKDGRDVYVLKSGRIMRNLNGEPVAGIINLVDITRIKEADREILYFRSRRCPQNQLEKLVGTTPQMHAVFTDILLAAQSEASILITGESGTGKELAAEAIHALSGRSNRPFIAANCCSLPENLLESELFGHVRGAFTGAFRNKLGKFEAADGGTIFIDEIGDLPPSLQVKLLRFLQSKKIERIGQNKVIQLNVRIISATNQDLVQLVREGRFREDLFYRINVFPLRMPNLRDRREDIPLLVSHFVEEFSKSTGKEITGINQNAVDILMHYDWPGNVRELKNAIEHAFVRVQNHQITPFELPETILQQTSGNPLRNWNSDTLTRNRILKCLIEHQWHRNRTASALGISRVTLWKKMKSFDISPAD